MKIYCAGAFFSEKQLSTMKAIEAALRKCNHELFCPWEKGNLPPPDTPYDERRAAAKKIFAGNVEAMNWADVMLAVTDGYDTGTCFEIGWFYHSRQPIVAYTELAKPLNVMLQEAVIAICRGVEDVERLFAVDTDIGLRINATNFQRFSAEMI